MNAGEPELTALVWPLKAIGEAVVAAASRSGLAVAAMPRYPPTADLGALDRWLAAVGEQLGVSVEPMTATYREVERAFAAVHPALVRLGGGVLVVLRQHRGALLCLGPDGALRRTSRRAVVRLLQMSHEEPQQARISELLAYTQLEGAARARAEAGLLDELLSAAVVLKAWRLRLHAGAPFSRQLRNSGLVLLAAGLVAAHAAQYALFLLSWWTIGRAVLGGYLAPGWLLGWVLLLLGSILLQMLSTWRQGELAVGIGLLLRRRLLAGAIGLSPSVLSRDGVGKLLGRTLEAESLERLALSGGFLSALALLELALAALVLVAGAGGGWHALLLTLWLGLVALAAVRLLRERRHWTAERLALTSLTIEHIIGHRTRLAQELHERLHNAEDESLARYQGGSVALDRRSVALLVLVPRGWLLAGMAVLAPAFVAGADPAVMGAGVGGVVLVWLSLARLAGGLDQLASARVAWERVAPLFQAASQRPRPTPPELAIAPPAASSEPVLEVADVSFRHTGRAIDILTGGNLVIRHGDRVLIQGPSGGGKSTLVSLLTGMQLPRSGLVLARGLDISCLGEVGWRSRVAAAPQFHENHVLTETFAFNLLMSRAWPPSVQDLDEAREICVELGLGPLLDRMPGGMYQMIGETGWQLSHGERSRLFIARALLQNSEVVILDESLAALDPENIAQALRCLHARARSLVVVAHP